MAPSARDRQVVDTPLGRLFSSPKKRNRHVTRSGRETITPFGRDARLNELQTHLQSLLQSSNSSRGATASDGDGDKGQSSENVVNNQPCGEGEHLADVEEPLPSAAATSEDLCNDEVLENAMKRRRIVADSKTTQLYARWQALICDLEGPYLD